MKNKLKIFIIILAILNCNFLIAQWVASTSSSNCTSANNSSAAIIANGTGYVQPPPTTCATPGAPSNWWYFSGMRTNSSLCVPNNFTVTASLRNSNTAGLFGISEFDTHLQILDPTNPNFVISSILADGVQGGNNFAQVYANNQSNINIGITDLILNLSTFNTFQITITNGNTATYFINGVPVSQNNNGPIISHTLNSNVCSILLGLAFKGSGDVDWITVTDDNTNTIIYNEQFNVLPLGAIPNLCNPVTTLSPTFTPPSCLDNNLRLFATPASGSGITYSWTGPNGFTSTQQNPVINAPAGTYNGSYTVTASNGCAQTNATATFNVNFNSISIPAIVGTIPNELCIGATLQLSNPQSGGSWSTSDANVATISAGGLVTVFGSGSCDIYYTYGACVQSVSLNVGECYEDNCTDFCYWRVTGNSILGPTDDRRNVFGTLSEDNVRIKTSNQDRGILTYDGRFGWNTGYNNYPSGTDPSTLFHINCDAPIVKEAGAPSAIRFEKLQEIEKGYILVIDDDGYVYKTRTEAYAKKIQELENKISMLENRLSKTGVAENSSSTSYIKQNVPNPFSGKTVIEYNVSEKTANAYIMITDLTGKELNRAAINNGKGILEFTANQYTPGMYIYTLVVNGNIIDSKKMIISK